MITGHPITAFGEYANEIQDILNSIAHSSPTIRTSRITNILNGKTTRALKRLVALEYRKNNGIFFTGSQLSKKMAGIVKPILNDGAKVIDPACGAGNLLLFCLYHLPKKATLIETLEYWSDILYGYDLYEEFVLTARLRFLLYTVYLFPNEKISFNQLDDFFQNIKVKDSLKVKKLNEIHGCVVVNPPFGYAKSTKKCEWANGKIQIAGLFMEKIINDAPEGQHIVSILPDVLRSGTRYKKWREFVGNNSKLIEIEHCGRFDSDTDVDVFILHLIKSQTPVGIFFNNHKKQSNILSNYFDICVGPVVPHRDPETGTNCKYLYMKNSPAGKVVKQIKEKKMYSGRVFKSPLLTMHRTSSPSDKKRCKVTVINTKGCIAIENHLIVLKPKDNSLETCIKFQELLSSNKTAQWLNKQIRCRHLTVASVKYIPVEMENIKCKEE